VLGQVTTFDDPAGVGVIRADDGTDHPFQCTQIADGTRTITVGARVAFTRTAWHGGRWEATAIESLAPPPAA
jgi:cold shock CspA family protein